MGDASHLRQGSIIWLSHVPDPQGRNPKAQLRPFVIVSATGDIRPGNTIVAVAVTSTFREPVTDPTMVPMRWNPQGTTETGFRRRCFAKVDWAHMVTIRAGDEGMEFDGEFVGTHVRPKEMREIMTALEKVRRRER